MLSSPLAAAGADVVAVVAVVVSCSLQVLSLSSLSSPLAAAGAAVVAFAIVVVVGVKVGRGG